MTAPLYSLAGKRVWVAGHRGLVGGALVRRLAAQGCDILTCGRDEADLRRQTETEAWIAAAKPDAIFLAAATVGGIHANDTRPGEFLYDNLAIEANIIEAARRTGVEKLVFLGSSCIYPKHADQPIGEDSLLTGPLEPTNEWYALAKIAGIKLCDAYRRQYGCDFISVMPANLYGPGDNFHLTDSHVLPALMRRFHEAKASAAPTVTVWGTGTPLREFLYVDDLADGTVFLAQHFSGEGPVNIGTGEEVSIGDLAALIRRTVGYAGELVFDRDKPDGTPRKVVDSSRLHALGWRPSVNLEDGVARTYAWLTEQLAAGAPINGYPVAERPAG